MLGADVLCSIEYGLLSNLACHASNSGSAEKVMGVLVDMVLRQESEASMCACLDQYWLGHSKTQCDWSSADYCKLSVLLVQ